jgi:hypothetical protein
LDIFQSLLPLVESVAGKLRFALIVGIVLVTWIFIWMFFLQHFSLASSLIVLGVICLPLLILTRFWWALEQLKDLPNIAGQMMNDAQGEIQETVNGIKAGNIQKLGFLGSARSLWSIGSLATEAKDLLGSYISIGTLANPFSLILGALSLMFILALIFISLVLGFYTII